ncbi:carboxyl-terminal processing protease [Salinimicrobium catena]|uniref:Carboxyl-terminal processing protease n=1 Tax=Salinimicrobium catena TaxID=390640 RepID=A0A1H5JZH0_9FLAO|nr:carboxy terminal-processing peptidase [Salinimicrobium catena]SDK91964.1 carboxyl-terminal processing protease [Salinimicrobium catena]SEE57627.1 carboxyl-terminal processing protease [Salinimicrobium catena]
MRRNYKLLVLVLLFAAASCSFTTKTFNDPNKDKTLIELIAYVLENGHYDAKEMDDSFSREVYKDYLESIDPLKRYFYASDIKEFKQFEDQIDDQVRNSEITFFDLTHSRLVQRMEEAEEIYKEVLSQPFDYSKKEVLNTDYDEQEYVNSKEEMKERWRKQLKFSAIANFYDKKKEQKRELENDPDYEVKSDKELEAEARELTLSSLEEYFDFNDDLERKDWFSFYVNAIVEEFDPHTYYFAPQDKDRFDMAMSGKLEGIGARLQKKNDNVKIVEIISGGPAWRGEEVEVGDEILKVKQEDEKEPVSVVGMRLDDAVSLIKGPKGTKVTLTLRKVDGTIEDVEIVRDVVEIEETYAKTSIVEKNDRLYGVINLPKFYFDMENYSERNAASDVKKEIIRLKEQGMEGLVIDLRNNGGGSLKTVVDIAGLFIKEGPIVQVKSKLEGQEVLKDTDPSVLWDGPLVILVNELSASASEILAAAMQDYKRAIIIGSKQTYGKGTVQNVLDLNRWVRNSDFGDLGALKITTQKFYRVNGGSTQLEGVKSDVVVPDRYSYIDIGEKDQENPLPWDQIEAANFQVWDGYIDFEETVSNSKKRMAQNEHLRLIEENAEWIRDQRNDKSIPLSFEEYRTEMESNEQQAKRFNKISEYQSNLTYESLPYEKDLFTTDTVLAEKRQRWHENLSSDVYMEEAVNVLEDMKMNNIRKSGVAQIKE